MNRWIALLNLEHFRKKLALCPVGPEREILKFLIADEEAKLTLLDARVSADRAAARLLGTPRNF